ncbi:MAG: 30S ribosomal protein S1 [Candidatus Helarchaeota archaeon]|nr:30S ribosomal protein S1 [Candidatus Helarchaeota archaeon]
MPEINNDKVNEDLNSKSKVDEGGDAQLSVNDSENKTKKRPLRPILKMENIIEESEYSDEEYNEYLKLYEETLKEINEGEIVTGRILSINDKEVTVDIGFKSEGNIPTSEFDSLEDLRVGDEIPVFLDSVEDKDGQLVLSKWKADFTRIWDKLMEKYEKSEVIEGKCLRRIKGGIVVDLNGIDAFLPGSQIDVKPIRDFDAFIGQTLPFKIVKVNNLRKNIVVSRRALIEGDQAEQKEKILKKIEKGKVMEGTVKNITDFGVFVDLGGADGLLHITDLSWGRVSHPSEIVSLDEKIKVMILDFDDNKERISLGLKQLTPHPWEKIDEKYQIGQRVKGKAVSITDYGVFVELEKGIEGLVHISEMSWTQHIKHPSKFISLGEELEVVILNIDKQEKKISLGLKQIEPDPWLTIEEKYPVGSKHKGKVRNITNFGVFVELEEGVDGLIHISDLSWTKKVRHPNEIVDRGNEIDVVILGTSKKDRRISLGHKQIESNPWDRFEKIYKKGVETKGKVVRSIEKGLIVELPENVEGFVPFTQLTKINGKRREKEKSFQPREEIPLKVIEFDKNQKKIVLSYDIYIINKEKQEAKEYVKSQEEQKKSTIGDKLKESGEKILKMMEELKTSKITEIRADSEKLKEKKIKTENKSNKESESKSEKKN